MKNIQNIFFLSFFLGSHLLVTAKELPSQPCLLLAENQIEACLDEVYKKWDQKFNETPRNIVSYLDQSEETAIPPEYAWSNELDQQCSELTTDNEKKPVCRMKRK